MKISVFFMFTCVNYSFPVLDWLCLLNRKWHEAPLTFVKTVNYIKIMQFRDLDCDIK